MAILTKIIKAFKRQIEVDENRIQEMVVPQKLKYGKMKMNTKVIIPENFDFAFGYNGHAYDIIKNVESFEVNGLTIPRCVKKFKLAKPNKNGRYPDSFKVNCYYIGLIEYNFEWKTYRKMQFKDENFGIFKAGASGDITLKVNDSEKFLQSLLLVYSYLKKDEPKQIVNSWLSEISTNFIEKNNYSMKELLEKQVVSTALKEHLVNKLNTYGLEVIEFNLLNIEIPKKYTANFMIAKPQEQNMNTSDNARNVLFNPEYKLPTKQEEEKEIIEDVQEKQPTIAENIVNAQTVEEKKKFLFSTNKNEENELEKVDAHKSLFGNQEEVEKQNKTKKSFFGNEEKNSLPENTNTESVFTNFFETKESEGASDSVFYSWGIDNKKNINLDIQSNEKERNFVDLTQKSLYHKDRETKICPYCGEVNSIDNDFCCNRDCKKYMGD